MTPRRTRSPSLRRPHRRPNRRGFTLVEMLTTVAALIIALGMMVNLARIVRRESADEITKRLLRDLDLAMQNYVKDNGGQVPDVAPLIPGPQPGDEQALLRNARQNNHQFVLILRTARLIPESVLEQPQSYYDGQELRDAWGTPIVFMPHYNKFIGQAPRPYFFVSAGPDQKFLTIDDNVNSYE